MEDLTKLGRKEREKLLRRQEILQAAATLFAEKGFNNTTLEDIALSSEFGIGTIYNYFQSKEEIFRSIIDQIFDANLEVIESADSETDSLVEFIRIYTRRVFGYFWKHKDALLMMVTYFTSNGEHPLNLHKESLEPKHCLADDKIVNRIKKGIQNKEIRDFNPENLHLYYHSLVFPYLTQLLRRNKLNEFNINEHADFILDVLFNGILINKSSNGQ